MIRDMSFTVKSSKLCSSLLVGFFFTLFIGSTSYSQSFKVTGKVFSAENNSSIEFATIKLLNPADSSLLRAMYAEADGSFAFDEVECEQSFILKISHIGFESKYFPSFISNNCENADFGNILLELDKTLNLEEVKVKAQIDVLKAGIDKKVYNVGEDISVKGGTANDVLNRLPSVEVDEDGGVTLRGDGSVIILINGRPSSLSGGNGKTLLDALPAGSIERVEIVTNPSARYDPDGTSGIINIVLKKNKLKGFNGSLSSNLGTGDIENGNIYEGNISLNYRNDKLNIFTSYNGRSYRGYRNKFSDIYENFSDGSLQHLDQNRIGTDLNISQAFRSGLDLNLSQFHKLGIYSNISLGRRERTGDLWNSIYNQNEERTALWNRTSYDPKTRTNMDFGLNYEWIFAKERGKLQFNVNQSFGDEDIRGYYAEYYYTPDSLMSGEDSVSQRLHNIESNDINSAQLDVEYILPSINARIETGAKSIIRSQSVNTFSESFDHISNTYLEDTIANFDYNYDERIFSLYGIFGQQIDKFKYQAGLRAEKAYQIPNLVSDTLRIENDYFNLFPSAHLKYAVNDKNEFGLSYSRRISRARAGQLNPFTNYADPFNLRRGNPYLQPEYIHSFDLAYLYESKKFSMSTSIYYRRSKGVISRIKEFYDNNTSAVTYQNLNNTNALGTEWVFMFKPYSFWRTTASFNGNMVEYLTDIQGLSNTTGFYMKAKVNSTFEFWNKTGSLQVSYGYNGPRITVQGIVQRIGTLDFAFEKKFFDGDLSLGFRVSDLLNQQAFYMDITRDNINQQAYYKWMSRRIFVTARYKFGKVEVKGTNTAGPPSSNGAD
ncbi:MAG: TonB-dependent receptor domain-containing protein [Crocinitomicaceae bacterium]